MKRLVIETLSVQCDIPSGTQFFTVELITPNPDTTAVGIPAFEAYFFPVVPITPGGVFASAPSAVRIYMNPGAAGSLGIGGEFPPPGGNRQVSVSGHLETQ